MKIIIFFCQLCFNKSSLGQNTNEAQVWDALGYAEDFHN